MMKNKTIIFVVFISIISTISFPLVNFFITTPSFNSFVLKQTEKKLTEIASNISLSIDIEGKIEDDTVLKQSSITKILESQSLFNLEKIKVFSLGGQIIYSTDATDIGGSTKQDFLGHIIYDKTSYSLLEVKKEPSVEGDVVEKIIVETYVPIWDKNRVIGVFEIYYDISERQEKFNEFLFKINMVFLLLSLLLLTSVIISAVSAYRSHIIQRKVEDDKDKVIEELTLALEEISTLQGILPLCSFCKKVRDDSGYWEQVDVYINKYSDVDISHSICPDCFKDHYPKESEAVKLKKKG